MAGMRFAVMVMVVWVVLLFLLAGGAFG